MDYYQFRHFIFCERYKIFPNNESGRESDEYDSRPSTFHSYLEDKAYFRILTGHDIPFFKFQPNTAPGYKWAEISRISVNPHLPRKERAELMLKMLDQIANHYETYNIDVMCAVLERRLIEGLARFHGVIFPNHGEPVEYRGERFPVWGPAADIIAVFRRATRHHVNIVDYISFDKVTHEPYFDFSKVK